MNIRYVLASLLVVSSAVACGGTPKPAESPDISTTETSSTEDMPAPPEKDGDPSAAAATNAAAENAGAAGGIIKLATFKLAPIKKGKNDPVIEVKEDGTVSVDGKNVATIKGDQVDSAGGTSMLTIGVDGSLVGNGIKPGYKFEGDELVHENGVKLSVDDEGTVSATKDGKTEPLAKAEGGGAVKRAAIIATVLWLSVPDAKGAKK